MDFSQQFSVVTCKLSNNTKDTFESDENDFDADFFFWKVKNLKICIQEAISYHNWKAHWSMEKHITYWWKPQGCSVDYELPTCRNNLIFPADFNNDVVLESEEEELEENTLCLPHLGRISYDASLYNRDYLAASAFQPKCKSVCLETTIPPLTTRTAGEVPKQQMMFCATVAKGGANASVTLSLGSGASFCQLKTTINNLDS